MSSSAEPFARGDSSRAGVLRQLRARLLESERLTLDMRRGLSDGDAEAIERATGRLQTLALEFKLLADEYALAESGGDASHTEDEGTAEARRELEATAIRIARSAAIAGGVLERMVGLSQRLMESLSGTGSGSSYLASGRAVESDVQGIQLREEV